MSLDGLLLPGAAAASLLSGFLEQVPGGVVVFDHDGRPLLHNNAFTQIVGVLPGRVQDLPLESDPVGRALAGSAVTAEEVQLATASPRRVRVSVLPLHRDGVIGGGILLLVAASQAAAPEASVREILGVVGHDLRNPLAAMKMTAQLLGKGDEMQADRRATLARRLLSSATRMEAIVRNLLDYSRASAGALVRLQPEAVDLADVTRRVVEELEQSHPGRKAEHRVSGDPSGRWDLGRIEQVVGQLVSNAFRHGAESPPAVVTIDGTDGTQVTLVVSNQGPAIPPELLARIFDPFSIGPREPGAPRRQIGLGLFVVHEMVSAHGGSVTGSSSEEEGTSFRVVLPRTAAGVTAS
jgi:signal transduction histidine kinase